eukprot:1138426-Pelagomonas_calceolata.AAC.2
MSCHVLCLHEAEKLHVIKYMLRRQCSELQVHLICSGVRRQFTGIGAVVCTGSLQAVVQWCARAVYRQWCSGVRRQFTGSGAVVCTGSLQAVVQWCAQAVCLHPGMHQRAIEDEKKNTQARQRLLCIMGTAV